MMKRLISWLILLLLGLGGVWVGYAQDNGLLSASAAAYPGYTLFAPLSSTTTYLIDMNGEVVHTWQSDKRPGNAVYLLEDGTLLRSEVTMHPNFESGGGAGGTITLYDWDSQIIWRYTYSNATAQAHHDVAILPNGNVLMIAWEEINETEALAAGRNPAYLVSPTRYVNRERLDLPPLLWSEKIIEVNPIAGEIVWEWRAWDHLIQDYNPNAPNYGIIANNPNKIDLNYLVNPEAPMVSMFHINSIAYHPVRKHIAISVRNYSEVWIIDHDLTTEQAAGEAGDLLYRWGNPAAYDSGTPADQLAFFQHHAHWIPEGLPGAGHFMVFNNGHPEMRPFSTVDELVLPFNDDGSYGPQPAELIWQYNNPDFFASYISGAYRLPNGNTLITDGPHGRFREVTANGAVVWDYLVPGSFRGEGVENPLATITGAANAGILVNPRGINVFRAMRYGLDYPAFAGQDLSTD